MPVSEDAAEGNEIDTSADETNGDTPVVDGSDAASAPEAATAADDAEATEAETPDDQDESAVSDDTSETGEVSNGAYDQSNDGDSDHEELDTQESDDEDKEAEIEAAAAARRRSLKALKHKYSIQEVIKRRQVLLIQVVKEERGNKGAALTTYMSLAGRYCVLMPNSTHSGGISRKISNISDRKKLKQITSSLGVPDEMGLIVRTAGMNRTKSEIKRDYDYLLRLWNGIRELTLKSTAPALVYEEGNLIKRTIRDLYTRDIDEVLVEGEEAYRAAKDFMKLLMPSHAKKVQHYKDTIPLYHRYQVENQLEAMYQPVVQLRSGGYIVINPTEALISIDVNSGRATKEHNIEETAVKTNLEAAEEVARQLRLRDMAGLVVIDFIDMEDRGNNRSVERRMKDSLKDDRARIQVGRISSFGLMEMSRQRLRPNLLEVAMETCTHCNGIGLVRSVESASLMALRELEEEGIRGRSSVVRVGASPTVAVYLLNTKRSILTGLEQQYNYVIEILANPMLGPSDIEVTREIRDEKEEPAPSNVVKVDGPALEEAQADKEPEADNSGGDTSPVAEETQQQSNDEDQPKKKRRRRRRRRRGSAAGEENGEEQSSSVSGDNVETVAVADTDAEKTEVSGDDTAPVTSSDDAPATSSDDNDEKSERPRRRRGSRGGRRRRERNTETAESTVATSGDTVAKADENSADAASGPAEPQSSDATAEKPQRRRRRVKKNTADDVQSTEASPSEQDVATEPAKDESEAPQKRRRSSRRKTVSEASNSDSQTSNADSETESSPKPRRRRRTKAEISADEQSGTQEAVSKPRRRRASAKKVDPASASDAGKSEGKANTKPVVVAAETVPRSTSSEPAKSGAASGGSPSESASGSKKKGWWQRTFG
ncbi:MAG: Rne/Rng family ribonuclease [Kordiimonadaceae bacterium]|nr:Rne/Rng family ribonuclease [Kordiimonadaceae bacterium]